MKIGVFGAGKLGTAIGEAIRRSEHELVWQIETNEPPSIPDIAIDASIAEAVEAHLQWSVENGVPLVIGTTGWSIPNLKDRVGSSIGVLVAPNFSISVVLMQRIARILAAYGELIGADPYVFEHHHRMKADAPSGTAKMLAQAVLDGDSRKSEWTLGTAQPHQLSVGVLRAGSEFGTHVVGIDCLNETLVIEHSARSRDVFASGAVMAAEFLAGKKGVFTITDAADAILDPLFQA